MSVEEKAPELHSDIAMAIRDDQNAIWKEIGRLKTTKGRIAACDPLYLWKPQQDECGDSCQCGPVTVSEHEIRGPEGPLLKPGEYPVRGFLPSHHDSRWAATALVVDDSLTPTEWICVGLHGVDTGCSSFADLDSALACKKSDAEASFRNQHEGTHAIGEGTFVSFDTPAGDGFYAHYAGLSSEGELAMILTDLLSKFV